MARITTIMYDFLPVLIFRFFFNTILEPIIKKARFFKKVRSSVKVPEFDKHLKKAGGHIGRNVVKITIKMKTKNLNDKIKFRLGNLHN